MLPESFTVQCRTAEEFSEAQDILFKLGYRWYCWDHRCPPEEKKEWAAWDGETHVIEINGKEMLHLFSQHSSDEWTIDKLREAAAHYKRLTMGDKTIVFGPEGLSIDGAALSYEELKDINKEAQIYKQDKAIERYNKAVKSEPECLWPKI